MILAFPVAFNLILGIGSLEGSKTEYFNKNGSDFDKIPNELLYNIMEYLPQNDLWPLLQVGKRERALAKSVYAKTNAAFSLKGRVLGEKDFQILFLEGGPLANIRILDLSYARFNSDDLQYLPITLETLNIRNTRPDKGIKHQGRLKS